MKEPTNEEILKTPSEFLTSIEKQKKFCLEMALCKSPCPNCKTEQTKIEAARITVNEYSFGEKEHKYVCVNKDCGRELTHCVPLFGPGIWFWTLS